MSKNMKRVFTIACAIVCTLLLLSGAAFAQGQSGATLQASKTLDICDQGNGSWTYSGEVAVWNTGANDAQGLSIYDCLQFKLSTDKKAPQNMACLYVPLSTTTIPGVTLEGNAFTFPYSFSGVYTIPLDLSGTIRNSAQVNIVNHSGGQVTGPNPKDTWAGGQPLPCRGQQGGCSGGGCTYTQGYWGNKPDVGWPASGPQPGDLFFNSGLTYQQIMDTSDAGGNAYINLAHQYIAAVLNVGNGACEPQSVVELISLSTGFFSGFPAGYFCASGGNKGTVCGLQVTWAGILADYNQGTGAYAGNPGHCN